MNRLEHPQKMPVMAHLVLGYPNLEESLHTAEIYIRAGVQVLELQIPFSHPTADGPVITAACREAVRQGVTVRDCIGAIRDLYARYPEQEIMVMSYVNPVYSFGFQKFVDEMSRLGIRHLIIPDLPVDHADFPGFENLESLRRQIKLVPVLAANISDARLEKLLGMGFDFFYLMSDFKITGSTFSLHPRLKEVIERIRQHKPHTIESSLDRNLPITDNQQPITNRKIGIGFGISTPEQARLVTEEADLAFIGSALIQAQREGRLEDYLETLKIAFDAATEPV